MKRMFLLVFLIASLLLAACGGGGGGDTTTSQTAAPAGGGTGAEATTATGGGTGAEATTATGGGTEATTAAGGGTTAETATAGGDATTEETATAAGGATTGTATAGGGTAGGAVEAMAKVEDCEPAGPVVDRLIWWTRAAEGDPYYEHFETIAQNYTAAGGSPVEIVTVPDAEFKNKVSISAPAGEGADIMGPIAHDWLGEFALQQIAMEVPQDALTSDVYLDAATQGATYDGKLYGIPVFVESVGLIRNTELRAEPIETWEDLVAAAGEAEGDNVGFIFPALEQYHSYGVVRGMGGYIFKYANGEYDTNDIGLANEGSVAAMKLLRDLVNNQPAFQGLERQSQHDLSNGKMEAGQAGATINGPWALAGLEKAGITTVSVDPLPTLPNGETMQPFVGVQVFIGNAYSKNKEAALDLLKYVGCSDSVIEMFRGEPKPPARRDVLGEAPISEDQSVETWLEIAQASEPLPNIPAMSNVWKPWGDAMDAIITNNAPDEEVQGIMDTAVEQIKAEIAKTQQ